MSKRATLLALALLLSVRMTTGRDCVIGHRRGARAGIQSTATTGDLCHYPARNRPLLGGAGPSSAPHAHQDDGENDAHHRRDSNSFVHKHISPCLWMPP